MTKLQLGTLVHQQLELYSSLKQEYRGLNLRFTPLFAELHLVQQHTEPWVGKWYEELHDVARGLETTEWEWFKVNDNFLNEITMVNKLLDRLTSQGTDL